jgi:branched-chain amino acid transport system ATP-binding protein
MSESPEIALNGVEVLYEGIIVALSAVSLELRRGEIVTLLGTNGSGKTTTLKAISGLLEAERGKITKGLVALRGEDRTGLSAREVVGRGLVQVLEGRRCFPHLTVFENLVTGTLGNSGFRLSLGRAARDEVERVLERFPRLSERRNSRAGLLSGGEQQMLAIGRALMAKPSILLLDEPSMGLAPLIVAEIFDILRELNEKDGVSILLAEQNARVALRFAHRAYVLESGHVVTEGDAAVLRERDDIKEFYLGFNASQRRVSERSRAEAQHAL